MDQEKTKNWLKENWFKAGVLLVLLLVAYSIYHVLVVKPGIEKQEMTEAKAEAKKNLDSCISTAESGYSNDWFRECKSRGELSAKCIDIHELTFSDYLDKYGLTPNTYNQERGLSNTNDLSKDYLTGVFDYLGRRDDECSCRLPLTNADRLNGTLKENKNACYKLYPLN